MAALEQAIQDIDRPQLAGKRQMSFPIPDIRQEKTRTIGHEPPSTLNCPIRPAASEQSIRETFPKTSIGAGAP